MSIYQDLFLKLLVGSDSANYCDSKFYKFTTRYSIKYFRKPVLYQSLTSFTGYFLVLVQWDFFV